MNKTIVDHTLPVLCTPISPFQPILYAVNATATEQSLLFTVLCNPITLGSDRMVHTAATWRYLQRMCYNALTTGRKTPKITRSPWDFVTLPEEDRATVIGNMHKKFGKDCVCVSRNILSDKQTDTQTDVLIIILCHRSHGWSNQKAQWNSTAQYFFDFSFLPYLYSKFFFTDSWQKGCGIPSLWSQLVNQQSTRSVGDFSGSESCFEFLSVLQHCSFSNRKGICPVKSHSK